MDHSAHFRFEMFEVHSHKPKPFCGNCEYFDGGGLMKDGTPKNQNGDCRNVRSPRFTTTQAGSCNQFWPCTTRWPDCDAD